MKSDDLPAQSEELELSGLSAKRLVRAIAKRDARIAKKIEAIVESNQQLVRQNRELMTRTDALETAMVKFIERAQVNEGGDLVRRVMKDVDRSVL